MNFSTTRPSISGYYYVIWSEGESPILVWINYIPKGTLLKDIEDDGDYWTWGFTENDDPESIELDIAEPEKIMFSELIK